MSMRDILVMPRREFLTTAAAALACTIIPSAVTHASPVSKIWQKTIPSTGEMIPAIGMGTWITFNVGRSSALRQQRTEVLSTFFQLGGKLIDSSPMYGSAEEVVGHCLQSTGATQLFSATKTWTSSKTEGLQQFQDSQNLWRQTQFDLLQIHNLLGWRNHLDSLRKLKQQRKIRYIGITTSHGRRHAEVEKILEQEPIDFLQLTYNISDREAESRLLPLAQEKNVAVIANRPFQGGNLPRYLQGMPVPAVAQELQCKTWPQLLLNFVVSHPAITCAIPATSQTTHMQENMLTMAGKLANLQQRKAILSAFQKLA